MRLQWKDKWWPPVISLLLLASWEILAGAGMLSPLFFPPPSRIIGRMGELVANGQLAEHLRLSLMRLLCGFTLGVIPGLMLGLGMGWSRRVRALVDPFVAAAHPVPKIAILPLIMILFGIGEFSKFVAIAIAAFFPALINSMAGVRQIHPIHFEVARNYGAGRRILFRCVVLPGSLPMILAGMRLALNSALLLTVAVELVAARKGLGALIWLSWQTLQTEDLYAGLTVVAALGIGLNLFLEHLRLRLVPWQTAQEARR